MKIFRSSERERRKFIFSVIKLSIDSVPFVSSFCVSLFYSFSLLSSHSHLPLHLFFSCILSFPKSMFGSEMLCFHSAWCLSSGLTAPHYSQLRCRQKASWADIHVIKYSSINYDKLCNRPLGLTFQLTCSLKGKEKQSLTHDIRALIV